MANDVAVMSPAQVKAVAKLEKQKLKMIERQQEIDLVKSLLANPVFQIVGTVLACETAEKFDLISSGWSTAMEAGAVTLVGLHAIKEYGTLGGAVAALGMGMTGTLASLLGSSGQGSNSWTGGGFLEGVFNPFNMPWLRNIRNFI